MRHGYLCSALVVLTLSACTSLTPAAGPVSVEQPDAVVTDLGAAGGETITVNLVPSGSAGFRTQAVVHYWVDNDIYEYNVTLKVQNGTSFNTVAGPVVVPRKGASPKTKAVFTNLRQGSYYRAEVTARGNNGGTAATTALNSVPATADFDFTGNQDVEDTLSENVKVVFDTVSFNGTGTVNIETPDDGVIQNPTATEVGSVE